MKENHILPDDPSELQYGHPGILTLNENAEMSKITDFQDSFRYPKVNYVQQVGSRRKLFERDLSEKIQSQMLAKMAGRQEKPDYKTATMEAYNIEGFESKNPKPTQTHDYRTEQPVSYWLQNYQKIHGVTMVKTRDTVFRRDCAFSKPIEESWEEAEPYIKEHYP